MSTGNDNARLMNVESRCNWTDGCADAASLRRNIALVERLLPRLRAYAEKGVWDTGEGNGPGLAAHCLSEARYNG